MQILKATEKNINFLNRYANKRPAPGGCWNYCLTLGGISFDFTLYSDGWIEGTKEDLSILTSKEKRS
tara:strand:+ start:529 stop:729 length:201 start_codon:yes stop_codon:yes gene_type:complete